MYRCNTKSGTTTKVTHPSTAYEFINIHNPDDGKVEGYFVVEDCTAINYVTESDEIEKISTGVFLYAKLGTENSVKVFIPAHLIETLYLGWDVIKSNDFINW